MKTESVKEFLEWRDVNITVQTYLIDALRVMVFGLFASLFIGTTFRTLEQQFDIEIFNVIVDYVKSTIGAALGIAIAHALKAPQLVLLSVATVGVANNALGSSVGALVATITAVELGKIVSKEVRLNITVTPEVIIISDVLVARFVRPGVAGFMSWFGNLVKTATEVQPFIMGILVSALIGVTLTLPISSAAICIALSLDELAGGTTTAGCYTQMIGFVAMNYRENRVGDLMAQGLGTSTLQMDNIVLNPRVQVPPILASTITGLVAIVVFGPKNIPAGSGMGTCGLVDPTGVYTAMGGGARMQPGILLVCFVLPAVLTLIFGGILRRMR